MTARLTHPLRLVPPPAPLTALPDADGDAPRDDVLLPALGLAVGLVPWIGLRLVGQWSQPELAVAGLMALAAAADLARQAAHALRSS